MNLNQVTVSSRDVARSIEFYSRLGLRLIVESLPKYARFVFACFMRAETGCILLGAYLKRSRIVTRSIAQNRKRGAK